MCGPAQLHRGGGFGEQEARSWSHTGGTSNAGHDKKAGQAELDFSANRFDEGGEGGAPLDLGASLVDAAEDEDFSESDDEEADVSTPCLISKPHAGVAPA